MEHPPVSVTGTSPGTTVTRARRRRVAYGALLGLGACALVASTVVRVPYVLTSPGDATPIDRGIVSVSDAPTYPHEGRLLFLTVRQSDREPTVLRWLFAHLESNTEIDDKQDVIGCAGFGESNRLNDLLMRSSQDAAKAVALRRLDYPVVETATRVAIVAVDCEGPSAGVLRLGDVVTSIDGTEVENPDELVGLVRSHRPGETAQVALRRGQQELQVRVKLGNRDGNAVLGVVIEAFSEFDLPIDIDIDTARVGGPSAGLAFALAIVDELTPGDLAGGTRVGVTGTIASDGTIGPVGAVAQKAVAAREAGVRIFLVPAGEAREARAHAGGLRVVGVRTFREALRALERWGGDPVPELASGRQ